jgi:hypothetical protein
VSEGDARRVRPRPINVNDLMPIYFLDQVEADQEEYPDSCRHLCMSASDCGELLHKPLRISTCYNTTPNKQKKRRSSANVVEQCEKEEFFFFFFFFSF